MDWNDLRYLLAAARAGTLAGAARRVGVDQTTVARRIAVLEQAVGTRLFERKAGMLVPTQAGEAALLRAARIEQETEALGLLGSDGADEIAGSVRVTAVPILVNRILIPSFRAFCAAHPAIRLELIAETRNLSLTRREADIAIRLARPESGTALARRIGHLDYAVYGPGAASAREMPWITYEEGLSHLPQARFIGKAMSPGEVAALSVSDAESLLQAIRAGIGRSLLPCMIGDRDPSLRCLSGATPALTREIWLMTHRELRHEARIGAAIDWIERSLTASRRPRRQS